MNHAHFSTKARKAADTSGATPAFQKRLTRACVSKFELLSNPSIGVALLPAERAAAEYLAGGYPINLVVPFVASRRKENSPALQCRGKE